MEEGLTPLLNTHQVKPFTKGEVISSGGCSLSKTSSLLFQ